MALSWREQGSATLGSDRELEHFLQGVERKAFRMARYALPTDEDALDVVQDAMVRLVSAYRRRPAEQWAPLFYRILHNRIRDWQRRQAVRSRIMGWLPWQRDEPDATDPLAQVEDPAQPDPEQRSALAQSMQALEQALQALPGRQRQAFLLRAMEGLDVADTALAMGCSAGSVKTHYSRAVRSLRETLGEYWR